MTDPLAMEKLPSNILQRQSAADNRAETGARFWVTEEGLQRKRIQYESEWQAFNNDVKLYFKNTNSDLYSRLSVDPSNNFIIANDNFGNYIVFNVRATDQTQRGVSLRVDDTTKFPEISPTIAGSLRIVTVDDLWCIAAGKIQLKADEGVAVETYGLSVGYGTPPADGNILYTGSLISRKGTTDHTGYAYVPYAARKTSTSWDGDAKTTDNNGIIDLSAVFDVPAGVKAVSVRLTMQSTTVGLLVGVGPSSDEWSYVIARANITGVNNDSAGIAACDANGDIYFNVAAAGTANVTLVITGYFI